MESAMPRMESVTHEMPVVSRSNAKSFPIHVGIKSATRFTSVIISCDTIKASFLNVKYNTIDDRRQVLRGSNIQQTGMYKNKIEVSCCAANIVEEHNAFFNQSVRLSGCARKSNEHHKLTQGTNLFGHGLFSHDGPFFCLMCLSTS